MEKNKAVELKNPVLTDSLTELLRTSARRIIAEAVELEVETFLTEVSQSLSKYDHSFTTQYASATHLWYIPFTLPGSNII